MLSSDKCSARLVYRCDCADGYETGIIAAGADVLSETCSDRLVYRSDSPPPVATGITIGAAAAVERSLCDEELAR